MTDVKFGPGPIKGSKAHSVNPVQQDKSHVDLGSDLVNVVYNLVIDCIPLLAY